MRAERKPASRARGEGQLELGFVTIATDRLASDGLWPASDAPLIRAVKGFSSFSSLSKRFGFNSPHFLRGFVDQVEARAQCGCIVIGDLTLSLGRYGLTKLLIVRKTK
eukprot:COSAG05_NODE_56_length_23335_cov_15.221338_27_plen_108_part_00